MGVGTLRRHYGKRAEAPAADPAPPAEVARTYTEAEVQGLIADLERAETAATTSKEEVAELQRQLEATREGAARNVKRAEEVAAKQIADAEKAFGARLLAETEAAVTIKLREIEDARIAGVERSPTPNETVGDLAVERAAAALPPVTPEAPSEEPPAAPKPAPAKGKSTKTDTDKK